MNCQVCGFDNTPAPGHEPTTHCEGCGTRIAGGDKPFPGIRVDPDGHPEHDLTEPVVVDDELREEWPNRELEDVLLIKKATYHWGRGIGMEPDGHIRDRLITVEKADDECEKCGHDEVEVRKSQDRAGIAGGLTKTCTRCEHVRAQENWA